VRSSPARRHKRDAAACCRHVLTTPTTCLLHPSQELHAQLPKLQADGFNLVVISIGTVEKGKLFAGLLSPPFPESMLYLDASREVYAALGLYNGIARTFFNPATPKAIAAKGLDLVREAAKNYTLIAPSATDDALQQGGLLVVGPTGNVTYAWRDEGTADGAPIEAVMAAVRDAAAVGR
jgi:hypothetical protein